MWRRRQLKSKKIFIALPYVSKKCEDFARNLRKTKRILIHRIKEHKKIESSACAAHMVMNPVEMDFEDINIIDQTSNDMKLKIKELLHILRYIGVI